VTSGARGAALAAFVCVSVAAPPALGAQGWTADLYAGGARYDALAGRVGASNLVANLRHQLRGGSLAYVTAAAPLGAGSAFWAAAGTTVDLDRPLRAGLDYGAELGWDGYAFRDGAADALGGGGALHGLATLRASRGPGALELRGGAHRHQFSFPDTSGGRTVGETSARATFAARGYAAEGDLRWLHAPEGAYPYVGVQLSSPPGTGRVWGWAGRWMADDLDDTVWGVGASYPVGRNGELWAGVRQESTDPLYLGGGRTAWNVGFSRRLGGPTAPPASLTPTLARGRVRIRLPAEGSLGSSDRPPAVAGEFSEWSPVPMTRAGAEWVLDLPLESGVYRFAFVGPGGDWFVPERYPGRIDDGFGGHLALIVVP
jgi:hypothetical protein